MSHFSVMVVFDQQPTPDLLAEALAPFHEFETTGNDDQYVKEVDETEQRRKEYEEMKAKADNDFADFETWVTGWTGRPSFESEEEALKELEGSAKYGYIVASGGVVQKVVDRTNPNSKWDWYSVGGRFGGMLQVRPGATAVLGQTSAFGTRFNDAGVDIARVGDLDWDGMQLAKRERREQSLRKVLAELASNGVSNDEVKSLWAKVCAAHPMIQKTWEQLSYNRQEFDAWLAASQDEGVAAYRLAQEKGVVGALAGMLGIGVPFEEPDLDAWVEKVPAFTCWAVLKDGRWSEKGEMGWFGMSSNDKPEKEWEATVQDVLKALPEDNWLVVVDCHI